MTALLLSPPHVVTALLSRRPTHSHRRIMRCVAMANSQPRVAVDQLPHTITSHYLAVQNPQQYQKTYTSAVKAFVRAAVLAYECGYSEDTLRRHLLQQQCQGEAAADATQINDATLDEDTILCMRFITLVWVTCQLSPVGVRRWCAGTPVSDETMAYWRSFVSMILNGYFERRMSWFPIERLQLERAFTTGQSERPDVVAESARIVFTTLEVIAPQFPSM